MGDKGKTTFLHGLRPMLLYATRQAVADPKIQRPIHRHDDITELLFVYRGEGVYTVDGYSYPIRQGDLLLYNQGALHEVASATAHEIGTFCFGVAGLTLNGLPPGHMTAPENGFVRPAGDEYHEVNALCKLLFDRMELNTVPSREIVDQLFPALMLLAVGFPADKRGGRQNAEIVLANRMRQYIATHFDQPLTLASLGETLCVSPYYAAHIFKRITGFSPIQYMIRCRVGEAQNLVISTDYSAAQIAAIVGYGNVTHFSEIFSKTVGLPPIRYRTQYRERMRGMRGQ